MTTTTIPFGNLKGINKRKEIAHKKSVLKKITEYLFMITLFSSSLALLTIAGIVAMKLLAI